MEKSKMPVLSICIPTYNRGYVIKKTIDSVCSQPEFNNWKVELIVSDNASTDNTEQIVKDFQKKYNNIKYFRNSSNIWAMKNILKSYSLWTWKYVWCLWSDDFLNQWCLWYTLKAVNIFNPDLIKYVFKFLWIILYIVKGGAYIFKEINLNKRHMKYIIIYIT